MSRLFFFGSICFNVPVFRKEDSNIARGRKLRQHNQHNGSNGHGEEHPQQVPYVAPKGKYHHHQWAQVQRFSMTLGST